MDAALPVELNKHRSYCGLGISQPVGRRELQGSIHLFHFSPKPRHAANLAAVPFLHRRAKFVALLSPPAQRDGVNGRACMSTLWLNPHAHVG